MRTPTTPPIDGMRYQDLTQPPEVVGALLEAYGPHRPQWYNHWLCLVQTQGIGSGA